MPRQRTSAEVLGAALASDSREEFCGRLGLSWRVARPLLLSLASEVRTLHTGRKKRARAAFRASYARADKSHLDAARIELDREPWAIRYLSRDGW